MISILEEFFYGNLWPNEQPLPKDPAYAELARLIVRHEKKLLERLGTEDRAIFEKLIDAQMELSQITMVNSQVYGYTLGARMMAEVFL